MNVTSAELAAVPNQASADQQRRQLRDRLRVLVCVIVAAAVILPQSIAVIGLAWERTRLFDENAHLRQMLDEEIPKMQQQIDELQSKVSSGGGDRP